MTERKVKIEIICFLNDYEDDENLLEYIESNLNEVIDGEVKSVSISEGSEDD